MQTYQRRSQNRDLLRSSQSRMNLQSSECNRSSSKKKFIEVCSKKDYEPTSRKPQDHLRSSSVSLPIDFQEGRTSCLNQMPLNRSQTNLHPSRYHLMGNSQDRSRGHSLPTKTIIIREIIQAVPVNFSYIQPSNVRIEPQYNYRHSLPMKPIPHKNDIVRVQQLRQAAAPIRIFSNSPVTHFQSRKQSIQAQIKDPHESIRQQHIQSRVYTKNSQNDGQSMLSNSSYVDCSIKLAEIGINTQQTQLRQSQARQNGQKGQKKQNYNSLVITQEDAQSNFKQNLELRGKQCICDKIRNFTECSEIRINVKQVLKPKKNFVFV